MPDPPRIVIIRPPTEPGPLIGGSLMRTDTPRLSYQVNGAIISEAEDSDTGNVFSLDDKFAHKRWICQLPFIDDTPLKYLTILFPQGQEHPNRTPEYDGLVVFGWDEGDRVNAAANIWHSTVLYRGSDELAALGWIGEGEFTDEQEHVRRDMADVFYTDRSVSPPVVTRVGNLIGIPVYEPVDDSTARYFTQNTHGVEMKLALTQARKRIGFDRYRSVHRFTMVRVLEQLTFSQIRSVGNVVWTVNKSRFLTYEPGELAFSGFAWREVFGQIPNMPSTSRQYEVRLQFASNPDKWSPRIEVQTYTDPESGYESEVLFDPGTGDRVLATTTIVAYLSIELMSIFAILHTSAPVIT